MSGVLDEFTHNKVSGGWIKKLRYCKKQKITVWLTVKNPRRHSIYQTPFQIFSPLDKKTEMNLDI